MKFKKKIFTALTTSIVSIVMPISVVACSKHEPVTPVEPEEEPWNIGISFVGESKTVETGVGSKTFIIGEFKPSTPLVWGQEMSVETTSDNIEIVEGGYPKRPQEQFSIKLKWTDDVEPSQTSQFTTGFIFKFTDTDSGKTVSERIDNFVVKYTAGWAGNNITWKTKTNGDPYNQNFTIKQGNNVYYTDYFILQNELEYSKESITVAVDGVTGPNTLQANVESVEGTKVKVSIKITNTPITYDTDTSFSLVFRFSYEGSQVGEDLPITGFKIKAIAPYEPPTVSYEGLKTDGVNLVTTEGVAGQVFDSYAATHQGEEPDWDDALGFKLNKPLNDGDQIKVVDNKTDIDTTCYLADGSDTSGFNTYVNLVASFNNLYDPFVGKSEQFQITFQFYHNDEFVGEQTLTDLTLTLTYTPIPSAPDMGDNFALVFNPVEIDEDGDGIINFVGQVGRKGADSWEAASLHKGQFVTIGNSRFGQDAQDIGSDVTEAMPNLWTFTQPSRDNPTIDFDGNEYKEGLPKAPLEGIGEEDEEGLTEVDITTMFGGDEENKYIMGQELNLFEYLSTVTAKFYSYNPIPYIEQHQEEPTPDLGSSQSDIDFICYPPGYWEGDTVTATDQWIADRTVALVASYLETPEDESTRKYIYGNSWFINWDNYNDKPWGRYAWGLVTTQDLKNKIAPLFKWDREERISHGLRFGWSDRTLAKKYIGAGKTEYLTPNDFIYLDVIPWNVESNKDGWQDPIKWWSDSRYFSYNENATLGCNVCVATLSYGSMILNSGEEPITDPWEKKAADFNAEFGQRTIDHRTVILEKWANSSQHSGKPTDLEDGNAIDNWDNWACALCSGFTDATIKVNGNDVPALYWITQNIKFDYGHLPEYKNANESANQHFPNMGDCTWIDKDGIEHNYGAFQHASGAYMLPDKYSKTDPENIWFGPSGTGVMFVIREWRKYGETLDLPKVAGINWNGGNVVSGVDLYYPWIDIFWDSGSAWEKNLLKQFYNQFI